MRIILRRLVVGACTLVSAAALTVSALADSYEYVDQDTSLELAKNDLANWQKYLPDNVFAAHLSIPGTHDTFTSSFTSSIYASSAQTQSASFATQLANGVRAFDIRPGVTLTASASSGTVYCNHGVATTSTTLESAMSQMKEFLTEHPTEFFFIHMFKGSVESTTSGASSFATNVKKIIGEDGTYGDLFIDFSPLLTVEQMRGHIVLFNRQQSQFIDLSYAGNMSNWTMVFNVNNPVTVKNASNSRVRCSLHSQDESDPYNNEEGNNTQSKIENFCNLVSYSAGQDNPNSVADKSAYVPFWVMNFTSGEGVTSGYYDEATGVTGGGNSGKSGYQENAKIMNPLATRTLKAMWEDGTAGPAGIFLSDWVCDDTYSGYDVVNAVMENNFHYIDEWRIDASEFTYDFTVVDNGAESEVIEPGDYYLKNAATGLYLAPGLWWGTHAAAREIGIPITFKENGNGYSLLSTLNVDGTNKGAFRFPDIYLDSGDDDDYDRAWYLGFEKGYYTIFALDNGVVKYMGVGSDETTHDLVSGCYPVVAYEVSQLTGYELWQLVTEEELREDLEEASIFNPMDASFLFPGGDFYANDSANNGLWSTSVGNSSKCTVSMAANSGDENCDPCLLLSNVKVSSTTFYNTSWTVSRTLSDLPNGKYTLSYDAISSTTLDTVTFNGITGGYTNDGNQSGLSESEAWSLFATGEHNYQVGLYITDQQLAISLAKGKNTSATATAFDHFRLEYTGPQPAEVYGEYTVHTNSWAEDNPYTNHIGWCRAESDEESDAYYYYASALNISDNITYELPVDVQPGSVSYSRSVEQEGEWQMVYLPFAVEDWSEIAQNVYVVTGAEVYNGDVVLTRDAVEAGQPLQAYTLYIIKTNDAFAISEATGMTVYQTQEAPATQIFEAGDYTLTLVGNLSQLDGDEMDGLYTLADDKFVTGATSLNPFRAYFTVKGGDLDAICLYKRESTYVTFDNNEAEEIEDGVYNVDHVRTITVWINNYFDGLHESVALLSDGEETCEVSWTVNEELKNEDGYTPVYVTIPMALRGREYLTLSFTNVHEDYLIDSYQVYTKELPMEVYTHNGTDGFTNKFKSITLTFSHDVVEYVKLASEYAAAKVAAYSDDEEETVVAVPTFTVDDNSVELEGTTEDNTLTLTAEKSVTFTTDGSYTVSVPEGYLVFNDDTSAYSPEYTITGSTTTGLAVISMAQGDVKVVVEGSELSVIGLDADKEISVYTIDGRAVYRGREHTVTLAGNTVYVVTWPAGAAKATVK